MELVKFQIIGDDNYRKSNIHPARLVFDDGKMLEFAVNTQQLLQELKEEFLLDNSVQLIK